MPMALLRAVSKSEPWILVGSRLGIHYNCGRRSILRSTGFVFHMHFLDRIRIDHLLRAHVDAAELAVGQSGAVNLVFQCRALLAVGAGTGFGARTRVLAWSRSPG